MKHYSIHIPGGARSSIMSWRGLWSTYITNFKSGVRRALQAPSSYWSSSFIAIQFASEFSVSSARLSGPISSLRTTFNLPPSSFSLQSRITEHYMLRALCCSGLFGRVGESCHARNRDQEASVWLAELASNPSSFISCKSPSCGIL